MVRIVEVATGNVKQEIRGHRDRVESVAVSPDGKWLGTAGNDHRVVMWELATGRSRWTATALAGPVSNIEFSHDGSKLAVVGFSQPLQIYDAATGTRLQELPCPCRDMVRSHFHPTIVVWLAVGETDGCEFGTFARVWS